MDDNGFSAEDKSRRRMPFSWIWFASTLLICAVFAFVSVPKVLAQVQNNGIQPPGQTDNNRNRRYTEVIRYVFDFIQRHYIDEVHFQTRRGAA